MGAGSYPVDAAVGGFRTSSARRSAEPYDEPLAAIACRSAAPAAGPTDEELAVFDRDAGMLLRPTVAPSRTGTSELDAQRSARRDTGKSK